MARTTSDAPLAASPHTNVFSANSGCSGFGFHHNGASAVGIWLPVDGLHLHAGEVAVVAYKFERINVPTTNAAFLVRRGGFERARPVRPWVLRVFRPFHGFGHNLYLSHRFAALAMRSAYAVRTGVAAAYHQHVFVLGSNALSLAEFGSGKHTILLREQFEGKMHALEVASRNVEVAGGGPSDAIGGR